MLLYISKCPNHLQHHCPITNSTSVRTQTALVSDLLRFLHSKIKILDLKSIAKLKLVALLQREKSRDLFDFIIILDHEILTLKEILDISIKTSNINNAKELYTFIESKKEPLNDEMVYLSEKESINLLFSEIRQKCLSQLKNFL